MSLPLLRGALPATLLAVAACGGPASPPASPTTPAPDERTAIIDPAAVTFIHDVAWSPDSTRLAFSARLVPRDRWQRLNSQALAGTSLDLYVVGIDGQGLRRLTDDDGDEEGVTWYPDGRRIAFASDLGGERALYRLDVDGGTDAEPMRLTDPAIATADATWAPDGKRIVFSALADKNRQLYIATLLGTNVRQLTREPFDCVAPEWSPDGTAVVFQGNPRGEGKEDVFVVKPDEAAAVMVVTNDDAADAAPSWLPDGRVVFTSARGGRHRVVARSPLNDRRETLVEGAMLARVSPDGRWIAYLAGEEPDTTLYLRPYPRSAKARTLVE